MQKFWDSYVKTIQQYSVFNGRTSRREYWEFFLVSVIITIAASIFDAVFFEVDPDAFFGGPAEMIYTFSVLLPSIAVGIRRVHDVGKSGWFILVPLYGFYLTLLAGDKGRNAYGPDPLDPDAPDADTPDIQDDIPRGDDPLIKK